MVSIYGQMQNFYRLHYVQKLYVIYLWVWNLNLNIVLCQGKNENIFILDIGGQNTTYVFIFKGVYNFCPMQEADTCLHLLFIMHQHHPNKQTQHNGIKNAYGTPLLFHNTRHNINEHMNPPWRPPPYKRIQSLQGYILAFAPRGHTNASLDSNLTSSTLPPPPWRKSHTAPPKSQNSSIQFVEPKRGGGGTQRKQTLVETLEDIGCYVTLTFLTSSIWALHIVNVINPYKQCYIP